MRLRRALFDFLLSHLSKTVAIVLTRATPLTIDIFKALLLKRWLVCSRGVIDAVGGLILTSLRPASEADRPV